MWNAGQGAGRDPARQRAAGQRWYQANKATVAAKKDRKQQRMKAIVREAKAVPCADCGGRYPHYVMDFDHVNGTKVANISRIVLSNNLSALERELTKCEAVCANCHRERTHQRAVAQKLERPVGDREAGGAVPPSPTRTFEPCMPDKLVCTAAEPMLG